ncbi:hypothetical protein A0H81_13532 [Grifola frondosa]|uniref:Uncharacterized protein n=1 Tax=Grifola frondosa TaxID=5627 RepID=A0A1C7LP48_GRIFR|nr:hypothetical protein A0H81_13532 [Grifola frondosa]
MTSPIPNGTPVRDRVYRSELASSSNASPSPRSVSSNANQPIPTSQPVSVDALLAAHAGAAHPSLAALDVAVAERNSLSRKIRSSGNSSRNSAPAIAIS